MKKGTSLLKNIPLPIIEQTRKENPINGQDAELLAASRLMLACGAELKFGSRNEDAGKVDMTLTFAHPWIKQERITIPFQVKSGHSYGKVIDQGFTLKRSAKKAARRQTSDIGVLWVERSNPQASPTPSTVYWAYLHRKTKLNDQKYGIYQTVSPATTFDLTRCVANTYLRKGERGIIIKRAANAGKDQQRATGRTTYKNLGKATVVSPLFGKIHFTRYGWRHILRKSRRAEHKAVSLECLPYLVFLLNEVPDSHRVTAHNAFDHKGYRYRTMEYLLTYKNVKRIDETGEKVPAIIRVKLLQEIRYPENWLQEGMLSQRIEYRVVFVNGYYRK